MSGTQTNEYEGQIVTEMLAASGMANRHTVDIEISNPEVSVSTVLGIEHQIANYNIPTVCYRHGNLIPNGSETVNAFDLFQLITTERTSSSGWLDEAILTIEKLLQLEENWNFRGAKVIERERAEEAKDMASFAAKLGAPKPHIYPSPDSGLTISFQQENRALTFMIEEGLAFGLLSINGVPTKIEGDLGQETREVFYQYFELALNQLQNKHG